MNNTLELINFRIHENIKLSFNKNIIFIYGNNGVGKTTILESIYFLSTTKSFKTSTETDMIMKDKEYAKIIFHFNNNIYEIVISKKGKYILVNNKEVNKISDYIGLFNTVVFSPDDMELIKGEPKTRRKFIDTMYSQIDKEYLELLIRYKKMISQRNKLLKELSLSSYENRDFKVLDIIDYELSVCGIKIMEKRQYFLDLLNTHIKNYVNKYSVLITYVKSIKNENNYLEVLKNSRVLDINNLTTMYGIHKDDFIIKMNDIPAKNYSSQGEQRLLLINIKLALFQIIKDKTSNPTILLLDDIMSELDKDNQNLILSNIPVSDMVLISNSIKILNMKNIQEIELKRGI
ncbi:MAG: DNA replication and repair protein RecF [Acholeplasmatales bacterium]|jgi:DNA replication and repair protein RecF|nr:DNA replication and repair protein RecF [Acholeplasmatales bacterium]